MKRSNSLLMKEFNEYAAQTPMNDEEHEALLTWVKEGHSVHENGSMASYEGGRPVDFLDVYREEEEVRKTLESLEGKEKEKYLRKLRGERNMEDLEEENNHYTFLVGVYEYVLRKYGLMKTAEDEIKAAQQRSEDFCRTVREANEGLKRPFSETRG